MQTSIFGLYWDHSPHNGGIRSYNGQQVVSYKMPKPYLLHVPRLCELEAGFTMKSVPPINYCPQGAHKLHQGFWTSVHFSNQMHGAPLDWVEFTDVGISQWTCGGGGQVITTWSHSKPTENG